MILWVVHHNNPEDPALEHIYHSTLLLSLRYRLRLRGMGKTSPRPLDNTKTHPQDHAHTGRNDVHHDPVRHPEERHGTRGYKASFSRQSLSPHPVLPGRLHAGQARHRHEDDRFLHFTGANTADADACAMPCTPARPGPVTCCLPKPGIRVK